MQYTTRDLEDDLAEIRILALAIELEMPSLDRANIVLAAVLANSPEQAATILINMHGENLAQAMTRAPRDRPGSIDPAAPLQPPNGDPKAGQVPFSSFRRKPEISRR